jgi:hypothetical protein
MGVIAALTVLSAAACVLMPGVDGSAPAATNDCETVYVTSNGFHTGVAIPAAAARSAGFEPGAAAWLEFGWGEARAYRAERLSAGAALGAIFAPGRARCTSHRCRGVQICITRAGVTPVAVTSAGAAALARDLAREAARDAQGRLIPLGPGKGEGASFVLATTPYRAWRTCNVWTAERLRAAGVPVRAAGSTLAPVLTGRLLKRSGCPTVENRSESVEPLG